MKRILTFLILAFQALALAAQTPVGYWRGSVDVNGVSLELCFDILQTADGFSASLDVPAQGARGIKVDKVEFDGLKIALGIKAIGASFEGMYIADMISGSFKQSGLELPLDLTRGKRDEMKRPQEPRPPFPYSQEEVRFSNKQDNLNFAGTLTVPDSGADCPAVVLVTGSGTQNRDEELMGHKPFAVIADQLSRNGIAVLRYDDRGAGGSDKGPFDATTFDFSRDAQAAVEFLRERGFSKVGILGHSEGGAIAFILSAKGLTDFAVSLAGPAVKGSELLKAQQKAIYEASGLPEEAIKANEALFAKIFAAIDESRTIVDATPKVKACLAGVPDAQAEEVIKELLNPWMFTFCKYDPSENIASTTCPVLALNGSKDCQVVASQNVPALVRLSGGRFDVREMPGLNHLFQHCGTGLPAEYFTIEETMAPEVLEAIIKFIQNI